MLGESFRARLRERRELSPRVVELTLEVLEDAPFRWLAGQHVLVGLETSRDRFAFSIARADDGAEPARPVLAVGDASSAAPLLSVPVGGPLVVLGPFGSFTWRPAPGALLIGVGTGVAPLKALAEEALAAHRFDGPLVLLAGQRAESDVLWSAELAALARSRRNFRFEPTLTLASGGWQGLRGRVQEHIPELLAGLPPRSAVYVCGKTPMVESCRDRLARLDVEAADITSESY
jgi:NAD(P)H-flavin reductase